ncbi:MAG: conserved rane protein of unknown function [Solirubrobacterales bacterium]|nr:conserved rane protein of unknown function [Solirubrobacterales bacterium]
MSRLRNTSARWRVGLAAALFSVLYLLSDVLEAIQGGFSDSQLVLTLVAEAAIPGFVVALYLVQRPAIGRLGRWSAIVYAYSFTFFTGTVVYALADRTRDYATLSDRLQPWMTLHGAFMLLAGLGFGYAVLRAHVLPRWTGVALGAGVFFVAISQNMPEGVQVVAAAIRDLGFFGMGASLLRPAVSESTWEGTPDPQRGDLSVIAMAADNPTHAWVGDARA